MRRIAIASENDKLISQTVRVCTRRKMGASKPEMKLCGLIEVMMVG